jgi:hypothetical protein
MDNKKDLRATFLEIRSEYTAYLARFAAFEAEHQEYLKPLLDEAEKANYPRADPQEIFNADAFIEDIEAAGMEDAVEDFDALKYKKYVYHQYSAFIAEGRYYSKILLETEIAAYQEQLVNRELMLVNAQADLSSGNTAPHLSEIIALLKENIGLIKERMGILSLKLAAKQPHLRN